MKQLITLAIAIFIFCTAFAQSNKEDIEMIQAMYGKDKKALVAEFITPADQAKKAAFWNLYDKYETERKGLGKKRIALLEKYAKAYSTIDDKSTDEVMTQTMSLQKSVDGLIVKYYGEIKKSVGVKEAAQFYQLESFLLSATRIYILGNIPFIGELEKMTIPQPAK